MLEERGLMENIEMSHGIVVESRKKLCISGVRDVLSFDESKNFLVGGGNPLL